MRIAITGGAGFIGTELAKVLKAKGHDILLLDLKHSPAFTADLKIVNVTDREALIEALKNIDVIYHLAAEHRDDVKPVQKYYDVNVGGAQNIIAAAKANNINTIIFSSSVALYGLNAVNSSENDTPNPFNDYGRSKWESEKVFQAWANENAEHTLTIVRLVATFGPGNRGNIYNLMAQIAGKRFLMVGRGHNRKSIAYVRNVAEFFAYCLNFSTGVHIYNYADKPDLSMKHFVTEMRSALGFSGTGPSLPYAIGITGGMALDIAAKLTGRNFPISAVRVRKFCADTVVDASRAHTAGFNAPYTLEEGLRDMIAVEF